MGVAPSLPKLLFLREGKVVFIYFLTIAIFKGINSQVLIGIWL